MDSILCGENIWISVIIPVYNCQKYLEETVLSVLEQPLKTINIVLVDDGSTDGSSELCDHLSAMHSRVYVLHQQNCGVSSARNAGIEYIFSGTDVPKYIGFCDADDLWAKGFFDQKTVELLSMQYDLLGFQSVRCNSCVTRFAPPMRMQEGEQVGSADSVWEHSSQVFGSMLYSTKLLQKYSIRFPSGLKINEDQIFRMQCMYLSDTYYLTNRILYLYRKHPGSVSHQKRTAITKYLPVIQAWISSDALMNSLDIKEKGELVEGHAMAAVYVVDMYEEHYQMFGSKKELESLMVDHPELRGWIESPLATERAVIGNRWKEIRERPLKFRLRCYTKGVKAAIAWQIYLLFYRSKAVIRLVDKRRFPLSIEDMNQID